jgi:hypothetical protein
MYDDDEVVIDFESNYEPSYMPLTQHSWKAFMKYRHCTKDMDFEKRMSKACYTLYRTLDERDRTLIRYYASSKAERMENDQYYAEIRADLKEAKVRYHWLNYQLAISAGLISPYGTIEPPQHKTTNRKEDDNNESESCEP